MAAMEWTIFRHLSGKPLGSDFGEAQPAFPAATAARALGFGTSFIDVQWPPFHILAI
jgi:hypothetical protein